MPSTYKADDALKRLGVTAPLGVNAEGVHAFECLRLLTGTVNLNHKRTGKTYPLRYCHLTESRRKLKANSLKEIVETAFNSTLSLDEVSEYLNKTKSINRGYWENLRAELCLALAREYEADHTGAFLHIYRLFEMSSVALPLFYATAEYDYSKALSFLKDLPSNPRDGDLAILKKFSQVVAKEGGYNGFNIEVFYSKGDFTWDSRFADQIQVCVVQQEKLKAVVDHAARKIDIPFDEMPSFIISFRNRLFHNTLSVKNFNLDHLGGANEVCEPLIKPALNWFTLVICAILQQSIARYV